MSLFFITHDFGVVAQIADRVAVMREGRIVETGTLEDVLERPAHPYTRQLLAAVPENLARTSRDPPAAGGGSPASPAATGLPEASAVRPDEPDVAHPWPRRKYAPPWERGHPARNGPQARQCSNWRDARAPRDDERAPGNDERSGAGSARRTRGALSHPSGRSRAHGGARAGGGRHRPAASTGARSWRWSANRAAARPRSDARCCASIEPTGGRRCTSTGGSSPASPVARCVRCGAACSSCFRIPPRR